jgi:hypothetical protein
MPPKIVQTRLAFAATPPDPLARTAHADAGGPATAVIVRPCSITRRVLAILVLLIGIRYAWLSM